MDVNLLWQKRFRGLLPISSGALDDDGSLTFARPDELEVRTYQIVSADASGQIQSRGAISVETMAQLEMAARGAAMLGATDDDLYLFRDGNKTRLMPGRRLTFDDISISGGGERFMAGFTDMMVSTHTIAMCDGTGKVAWTKDVDGTVSRVAISADGSRVLAGSEEGSVLGFDAGRVPLFELTLDEPITALGLSPDGGTALVGTRAGTLAACDEEGGVTWRATVGSPILGVSLSADGVVGAAIAGDAGGGLVFCTDAAGEPTWEHEVDARPTGISLSPNGRFLAVSLADGRLLGFSLRPTLSGRAAVGSGKASAEARCAWEAGERERACRLLRDALLASPDDVAACEQLVLWEAELVGEHLAEAEAHLAAGEVDGALDRLAAASAVDPYDARVPAAGVGLRSRAVQLLRDRAAAAEPEVAIDLWNALLALDAKHLEARRALGEVQLRWATRLAAEGDALAAGGDAAGALERWRHAQELAPSEELARRIGEAEVVQIVAEGRRLYDAKRYPEAAFQFQKALAIDPDHEEARRYLGYTRGLATDSGVAGRFQRLE
jgi:tetratricopeptide (TPR) repeat protein